MMFTADTTRPEPVSVGPHRLEGFLDVPDTPKGLVIFAHGSGSGRFSPRNNYVARALVQAGYATLLLDLLTPQEEADRANVFDLPLLASRLNEAVAWTSTMPAIATLQIGYFGASTGGGAAIVAAALGDGRIGAIVSRGGRPDLAQDALPAVRSPTLLLVGSLDLQVLELNRWAMAQLQCEKKLIVIPGASHLFEEPGTLDLVVVEAIRWFDQHLSHAGTQRFTLPFANRTTAGRALAGALGRFEHERPLVLGLPRGGVPVAFEVAKALHADLDLLLVRKLGAPGQPEVGIGAIIDGDDPQVVLNEQIVRLAHVSPGYISQEARRQLAELERRRHEYLGNREPPEIKGRVVIVVDDGIATGGTMRAALQGLRKKGPSKLVLAVPLAPRDSLAMLASQCDEAICLASPEPFAAVGAHYEDFAQTSDEEVKQLMRLATEAHFAHPA